MRNKRFLYSLVIILLTVITVGIMLNLRVDNVDKEIYDEFNYNRGSINIQEDKTKAAKIRGCFVLLLLLKQW